MSYLDGIRRAVNNRYDYEAELAEDHVLYLLDAVDAFLGGASIERVAEDCASYTWAYGRTREYHEKLYKALEPLL